jgi:ABC-type multidrug transport system fused ATPase/permease subunit
MRQTRHYCPFVLLATLQRLCYLVEMTKTMLDHAVPYSFDELAIWRTKLPQVKHAILPPHTNRPNPLLHEGRLYVSVFSSGAICASPSSVPLPEMKNVSILRGENLALDRLSLRIGIGEHVCILGSNGCGKSTLIRTITRENYPLVREDASMTILGQSLWNVFELRSLLGIVSTDLLAACTTDASGLDVVLSGFFSSTRIFPNHEPAPEHRRHAEAALARLNISHLSNRAVACANWRGADSAFYS